MLVSNYSSLVLNARLFLSGVFSFTVYFWYLYFNMFSPLCLCDQNMVKEPEALW